MTRGPLSTGFSALSCAFRSEAPQSGFNERRRSWPSVPRDPRCTTLLSQGDVWSECQRPGAFSISTNSIDARGLRSPEGHPASIHPFPFFFHTRAAFSHITMRFSSITAILLVGVVLGAPARIELGRDGKAAAASEVDTRNVVERDSPVCPISIQYHVVTHLFAFSS
jgi:hypothetical protein